MVTIVVILVALAAAQGFYNLVRDVSNDFPLVDPKDEAIPLAEESQRRAA